MDFVFAQHKGKHSSSRHMRVEGELGKSMMMILTRFFVFLQIFTTKSSMYGIDDNGIHV